MKPIAILIVAALGLSLSAPLRAEPALPVSRPQVSADIAFPDMDAATRPQGAFVPALQIALVTPGLRKSQVYTLLDVPHFKEGLFGVRRWNYILNFYTGMRGEVRQCQYQIRFDRHYRVEATYWKDAECAALFERALVVPAPAEKVVMQYAPAPETAKAVPAAGAARQFSFHFDFDRATVDKQGRAVIDQVVAAAKDGRFDRAVVTGFTDTAGPIDYNDSLGLRRAAATAALLTSALQRAESPLAQRVSVRGGRDLAVPTGDGVRELRNRRVLIELF